MEGSADRSFRDQGTNHRWQLTKGFARIARLLGRFQIPTNLADPRHAELPSLDARRRSIVGRADHASSGSGVRDRIPRGYGGDWSRSRIVSLAARERVFPNDWPAGYTFEVEIKTRERA